MIIPNELYSFYHKYNREIFIALGVSAALALGGYGYFWYSRRTEYNAQRDFAESAEDYYKLFSAGKTGKAWQDVEQGLAFRVAQNKSSKLAPYFIIYQADALLQQDKASQALELLANALQKLDKSSPFYYLYRIKQALIKIDSDQEATRSQGVSELDQLSSDKQNPYSDMAQYYRGYYAWNTGNKSEAQKIWEHLSKQVSQGSAWAQLAQVKLQGIA